MIFDKLRMHKTHPIGPSNAVEENLQHVPIVQHLNNCELYAINKVTKKQKKGKAKCSLHVHSMLRAQQ